MRPLWITLSNFGPYAKETIDLRGISAATIVGPTGSGKSLGIPEAITWCFFMEGRASDPDGFIRAGQTDAAVTVGFLVNGDTYRAARSRSIRTKRGKTEFAIHKQVGEEWEPVDRSIEDLIQADYTTLTASNFIMQKDPFDLCEARPKDRIALISKLLGHEKFADYVKLANKKANIAEGQVKALLEAQESVKDAALKHDSALMALETHGTAMEVLAKQITEGEDGKTNLVKKIATLEAQIAAIPQQEDTFAIQTQQRALLETKVRLEKQLREMTLLAEQGPALAVQQEKLSENEAKLAELEVSRERAAKRLEETRESIESGRTILDGHRAAQAAAVAERVRIEQAIPTVSATMKRHEEALAKIQSGPLSDLPCDATLQRQCRFVNAARKDKEVAEAELPKLREELGKMDNQYAEALKAVSRTTEAVSQAMGFANFAKKGEDDAKKEAAAIDQQYKEVNAALTYSRAAVQNIPKVQHAKETIPSIQEDLARNVQSLNTVAMELKRLTEQASKKVALQADLSGASSKLESQEAFLSGLKSLKADRDKKILEAQMAISETKGAKEKLATFAAEHEALKVEIEAYGLLAECYKRVPVLMMENVIPIIEEEANKALLKLSLKGMQLRFESQKALKTVDKVVDEMNIYVQDRDGERVYETYSGGEHGLGNFATRLGIAKLTSTRSGVKLETIIVDETFASMGEEVSQRVREYLESLTEQYPLVLIITHDVNLKGSLPTQITMVPSEDGTKVEISS